MALAKNGSFYVIALLLSLCLQGQSSSDQGAIEARLYAGGSYLMETPPEYTEGYFKSLRLGLNLGGEVIYFFEKIGLGLNFDQTNSSASGLVGRNGEILDQKLKISFLGPVLATRSEIDKNRAVTFYFSYGRQVIEDLATIDGASSAFNKARNVTKFALRYDYKISEVFVGIGIQYFNGNPPSSWQYRRNINSSPFGPSTTSYAYSSGIGLKRVGINISCSHRL